MISLFKIWTANRKTFYTIYQDGSKDYGSLKLRYFVLFIASLIFSITLSVSNDNFMIGLITAQAILIGFAFNVMVYISSQDALKSNDAIFRENRLKAKSINDLADEIFYNLSYFVTVALMSVIICLVWIAIKSDDTVIQLVMSNSFLCRNFYKLAIRAIETADVVWKFLIFLTTIESVITFSRLVRRVTFHFQERRVLQIEAC